MAAPALELKNVFKVASEADFGAFAFTNESSLHVLFLFATWHEPSAPGSQMDIVIDKLAELHPTVSFGKMDVDEAVEVAEQFDVQVVPTFIFMKRQTIIGKLEGADPAELSSRVEKAKAPAAGAAATAAGSSLSSSAKGSSSSSDTAASASEADSSSSFAAGAGVVPKTLSDLRDRIQRLTQASQVMLFMKGGPEAPKCKFSREMITLLKEAKVTFGSFDILSSEAVRQGLKVLSNWPTYPQLYVKGQLIGGLDIVKELKEGGELLRIFPPEAVGEAASSTAAATAMAAAPATATPAAAAAAASLKAAAPAAATPSSGFTADGQLTPALESRLRGLTTKGTVVLFMKGTPEDPECGFSEKAVSLLQQQGVAFETHNILRDPECRQGLKQLSKWPTFPQLYLKGELVGGLDILKEMAEEAAAEGKTLAQEWGL